MGLLLPTDDVVRIADRVKHGDPTVGWQGDPTMDCYLDEQSAQVVVMGFDSAGNRYPAATVSLLDQGWRHQLLTKLRDGDWRTDHGRAQVERMIADNQRIEDEKDARSDELSAEVAEKIAWGLRRDVGVYVDGLSKEFY